MSTRSVIYFAFLGDESTKSATVERRLRFMERQLRWLADLVLLSGNRIRVLVPYVAPRAWDADIYRTIADHGFSVDPESIRADRRNTFEYRGFRAMKSLAETADPESLIYYCHSKGIVDLDEYKMGLFRFHTEKGISADLQAFESNSGLTRAGLFPYKFGWCWYNFFWIKAATWPRSRWRNQPIDISLKR